MSEPQYGAGPEQPGQPSLNKPEQGAGGPGQPPPQYGAPQQPQQPAYGAAPQQGGPPQGYGPGPGQPAYGAQGAGAPLSQSDERLWATLGHVGGILFGFLAPLIVWLVQKDRSPFVNDQGREALNFQITLLIAYVVGWITSFLIIGFFLVFAAWVAAIVFGIMGAMAANKGEAYRYPVNIRMVK